MQQTSTLRFGCRCCCYHCAGSGPGIPGEEEEKEKEKKK
jgi:hypothetical protein